MHPEGKIENVLVKVDCFVLPANFIILDYETDKDVSILLGHQFLSMKHTSIDVHKGGIMRRVNGQEVIVNVFKVLECPSEHEEC